MDKSREELPADDYPEVYRRWQKREERKDQDEVAEWQEKIIANGDPECEELIAALEAGWLKEASR